MRVAAGDLDFQVFESLVTSGRAALASADPERAARLLGEALQMWRGPLLADVLPSPLLESQADRAAELRLDTTELRVEADLACGRAAQVVTELRGLVTDHPLRERLWALLMRALEEAGRRAEALETYAQARQVIADELGVDPGSELQRLYAELLAADASFASARHRPSQAPTVPDRVAMVLQRGQTLSRTMAWWIRSRIMQSPRGSALSLPEASRSALSPSPLRPRPWAGRCLRRIEPAAGFRVLRSSRRISATSLAVRSMSRTCARSWSGKRRRAVRGRCASRW